MTSLEVIGNILNLLGVWLAHKNHSATWWIGVLGCLCYAFLFYQVHLFADVTLQIFYILSSVLGWLHWKWLSFSVLGRSIFKAKGKSKENDFPKLSAEENKNKIFVEKEPPIVKDSFFIHLFSVLLALLFTVLYGLLLFYWTKASFPFLDSAVLMFSILAQILMIRRSITHWYFWIFVNTLSIGLFIQKDLFITAGVYFLFLLLAIKGLGEWKKKMSLK